MAFYFICYVFFILDADVLASQEQGQEATVTIDQRKYLHCDIFTVRAAAPINLSWDNEFCFFST